MCRSGILCTSLSAKTELKVGKNPENTNEPAMAYTILLWAVYISSKLPEFIFNLIFLDDESPLINVYLNSNIR